MPTFNHKTLGRVLFVHIPKAGGSSVEAWITAAGYKLDKINYHIPAQHQHAPVEVYSGWGDFNYEFATVRDPIDRFVSALGYRGIQPGDAVTRATEILEQYQKGKLPEGWGNHLQPQVDFVRAKTVIFKLEEDFVPEMRKDLGFDNPFPHINRSKTVISRSDLSPQLQDIVRKLYAADYNAFGYD